MRGKRIDDKVKAKAALEALRGDRPISEIATRFGIHPNQIGQWKKKVLSELPGIFSNGKSRKGESSSQESDELYKQIGRLKVENEFLKKKYDQLFG